MSTLRMDPTLEIPRPIASGPHVEKYRRYRSVSKQLHDQIMSQPQFRRFADIGLTHLGMQHAKSRLEELPEYQLAIWFDYSQWEVREQGENLVELFCDSTFGHSHEERQILNGWLDAETNMFHITDVNAETGQLTIQELGDSSRQTTIIDLNLSMSLASCDQELIIFLRPVVVDDFVMSSGFTCMFPASRERALLKEWNKYSGGVRFSKIARMHEAEDGIRMLMR